MKVAREHGKVTGSRSAAKGWRDVPPSRPASRSQDHALPISQDSVSWPRPAWPSLRSPGPTIRDPGASSTAPAARAGSSATRSRFPEANVQPDGPEPPRHGQLPRRAREAARRLRARLRLQADQGMQLGRLHPDERPEGPGLHRASRSRSTTPPGPACTTPGAFYDLVAPKATPRSRPASGTT